MGKVIQYFLLIITIAMFSLPLTAQDDDNFGGQDDGQFDPGFGAPGFDPFPGLDQKQVFDDDGNPLLGLDEYIAPEQTVTKPKSKNAHQQNLIMLVIFLVVAIIVNRLKKATLIFKVMMLASLLYFGFYRHGCLCPVGSIGNITLSLFNKYLIFGFFTIAIFFIPLLVSLFFGRVFCAGVCPLGAVQELLTWKKIKLSRFFDKIVGVSMRVAILIAVIYFAAVKSRLIICDYDPFVTLFRLSGVTWQYVFCAIFLALSLVIYRPFCRFFCPYSILLGCFSWLSFFGKRITVPTCVRCQKCVKVCPVNAIVIPKRKDPKEPMIDAFNCISCGRCQDVCPKDSI